MMRTGEGCGNAGTVERVEKQKQLSHSFPRPLEISQTARDFHISTPRLRDGGIKLIIKTGKKMRIGPRISARSPRRMMLDESVTMQLDRPRPKFQTEQL
jgi:hypothetical protein